MVCRLFSIASTLDSHSIDLYDKLSLSGGRSVYPFCATNFSAIPIAWISVSIRTSEGIACGVKESVCALEIDVCEQPKLAQAIKKIKTHSYSSILIPIIHLLHQFLPAFVVAEGIEVCVGFEVGAVLVAEADGFVEPFEGEVFIAEKRVG